MELRVLNYFLMAAREENITKAAAILHVTQPTLSRQLMQLEEELGVRLFDRSSHNLVLTEDGMLLRRRAEEIIGLAEKTKRELTHEEECIAGEISIGCGETKNMEYLSQKMIEFRERYPNVTFDIYTAIADDVKERIENGTLDMGLLLEPVEISKYHFIRIPYREKWCVLMRKDWPLAKKEQIEPKDLTQVPLLINKRKSVRNELESWFGTYYRQLNIAATCNLSYSNRSIMVENGMGVALVHEFQNNNEALCLRPIEPELFNASVLVWKKDQRNAAAVQKFIEYIQSSL